jgi:hypothetical protein
MPPKKTPPRSRSLGRAALFPGEALAPAKRTTQIRARLDIAKAADRRVRLSDGKTRTRPKA